MDSSSSNINRSQPPLQVEDTISYMDRDLFKAAEDGNMELLLSKYQGDLDRLVDGNQNTALHVYSTTCGREVVKELRFLCYYSRTYQRELSTNFVQQLLDKCPLLLLQANMKGEIPLHVAARQGHCAIVEFLVECGKKQRHGELEQMVRMVDKDQNTAVHTAAQYKGLGVVRALLKEDLEYLCCSVNSSGETPVFIDATRGYHDLVAEILDSCKSTPLIGPRGRTILHAAVLSYTGGAIYLFLSDLTPLQFKKWTGEASLP